MHAQFWTENLIQKRNLVHSNIKNIIMDLKEAECKDVKWIWDGSEPGLWQHWWNFWFNNTKIFLQQVRLKLYFWTIIS